MKSKQSPCVNCDRCKDPSNCENKHCSAWRDWWLGRWERMRAAWRLLEQRGGKR